MSKKEILFSSAGHNNQFLYRRKSHLIERLTAPGHPMGISPCDYAEKKTSYEPGDLLCLYTDGITEAMNAKEELFGESRLESLILSYEDAPLENLRARILEEVQEFQSGTEQHDDLTLFLIRLN